MSKKNRLSFTKMQGAGNDFIIIDNRKNGLSEEKIIALAPRLCHRRFGIGADGMIALQPPDQPRLDYTMYYRNADGSDAGMCGNGARCLALFAARTGLGRKLKFNVHDSVYKASVDAEVGSVTLSFPMQLEVKKVELKNESELYQVHAGTEHIVQEVSTEDFENNKLLHRRGEHLRYHAQFNPPGTNVNFICSQADFSISASTAAAADTSVVPDTFKIKTYERGVEGLTLACGTGAIAAAAAWHHLHGSESPAGQMKAEAEGGTLSVDFDYEPEKKLYTDIRLMGEAAFVFEGIVKF